MNILSNRISSIRSGKFYRACVKIMTLLIRTSKTWQNTLWTKKRFLKISKFFLKSLESQEIIQQIFLSHTFYVETIIFTFNNLYLIKCVICCNRHCICVQHQSFSKKCEKTMSMHDFNLSPVRENKNIRHMISILSKCKIQPKSFDAVLKSSQAFYFIYI